MHSNSIEKKGSVPNLQISALSLKPGGSPWEPLALAYKREELLSWTPAKSRVLDTIISPLSYIISLVMFLFFCFNHTAFILYRVWESPFLSG
jgi:hypothetical protein